MAPVSFRGFHLITMDEASRAKADYAAAVATYEEKIDRATAVGEYAQTLAPVVLTNVLAMAALSYLRIFAVLHLLNCRAATYAVPAAASYAANALAEKVQPAMDAVGSVAGFAARHATVFATVSTYDRYIAANG